MLKGLRTVIYGVSDLERATEWYRAILGKEPYFNEPFYVGFNVGGYELGLDPNATPLNPRNAGVIAYWGVDDIVKEHARLVELNAQPNSPVQEVGGNIKTASFLDPFGNIFGIIENPDFRADPTHQG